MIGGRRPLQGRKPGDRRVRVERPHAPYFRYTGPGQLAAKPAASAPTTPTGRASAAIRGVLVRPAAGDRGGDRRAPVEEARRWRSSARTRSARRPTRPRRSCGSWSSAGAAALTFGSRSASRSRSCSRSSRSATARSASPTRPAAARTRVAANFGRTRRLVAASALLIDYVLTVAVSTSSAVEQIRLGVPRRCRRAGPDRRRRDRPDHDRQPPRPARVRQHLRDPDVPVPRSRPADDRDRRRSGSSSSARVATVARPDRRPVAGTIRAARDPPPPARRSPAAPSP